MTAILREAWKRLATAQADQIASGTAFPTKFASRLLIWRWSSVNYRAANWTCSLPTRKAILSRKLRYIGCDQAHDLITSRASIVIKAANEFKDKTIAINQKWLGSPERFVGLR